MIYEILDAHGNVENTIVADAEFMQANYPNGSYRLVQPADPAPTPEDRRISKLAFRNRFTKAEKAGIEFAALDDPTAPIAQRQQAAALRADLKDQEQATFINLDDEDTRTGVLTLEAAGLIAAGRAVEILDAPVQDKEHHTG